MRFLKYFTAIILIPLIIIFLVLEIGVRASGKWGNLPYPIEKGDFNFEWGWGMDDNYIGFDPELGMHIICQEFDYVYDINSIGVREREIDPNDTASIRLFIYGDSFVEGNGAAYDSTWPRRIEQLLYESEMDASVYMTGISSSDPYYAYTALKHKLKDLNPTHFIATINDSDFDNYAIRGGFSRFQGDGSTKYRKPPPIYIFYKYSHLARMAAHQFLGYDHYLVRNPNSEENRREAADSLSHAMELISELCDVNDIEFMAVIHPTPHEVCFESEFNHSDVLAFNVENDNFPAVYMYEPMKELLNQENCYEYCWEIDSHFNGHGYLKFGEMVYNSINRNHPEFFN